MDHFPDISKLDLSTPEGVAKLCEVVPLEKRAEVIGYLLVDALDTFIQNKGKDPK